MAVGLVAGLAAVAMLVRSEPQPSVPGTNEDQTADEWPSTLDLPSQPRSRESAGPVGHRSLDSVRAGNAAYARGNLDLALEEYEAAVAAAPNHAEARNNLAQVLVRRGQALSALPHLDAAVQLAPDRWAYRFNRARAYSELERWLDAVAEYEAAIRLFPDDYATHYNLGLAFISLRRFPEAVRALEQAVAMAPDEQNFLITLGTAYIGAEQPARARVVLRQFLDRVPQDPEASRVKSLLEALTDAGQ
jgi:tetratricopeptide (TPR) repeat protein